MWNDNSLNYCQAELKPGEIFQWTYLVTELDDTLKKGEERSEMTQKFQIWETGKVTTLTKLG